MTKLSTIIITVAIVIGGFVVIRPHLAKATVDDGLTDAQYDQIRGATEQYMDSKVAEKDGFEFAPACVYLPGVGGEGYHFVNVKNMTDNVVDPTKPDALLYERLSTGFLQLVGVEYIIADADQNMNTVEQHFLYDQPMMGPMLPHIPGMPIHYDMHVYIYNPGPGPRGMFEPWNPRVSCLYAK